MVFEGSARTRVAKSGGSARGSTAGASTAAGGRAGAAACSAGSTSPGAMAFGGAADVQRGHMRDCGDRTEPHEAVVQSPRTRPRSAAKAPVVSCSPRWWAWRWRVRLRAHESCVEQSGHRSGASGGGGGGGSAPAHRG
eukprot:12305195-Alexandrium_andersonii.AAC.1